MELKALGQENLFIFSQVNMGAVSAIQKHHILASQKAIC